MKYSDIRDLSDIELTACTHELSVDAFQLRVQQKRGLLEKPSQLRAIRRKIARIETAISRRNSSDETRNSQ